MSQPMDQSSPSSLCPVDGLGFKPRREGGRVEWGERCPSMNLLLLFPSCSICIGCGRSLCSSSPGCDTYTSSSSTCLGSGTSLCSSCPGRYWYMLVFRLWHICLFHLSWYWYMLVFHFSPVVVHLCVPFVPYGSLLHTPGVPLAPFVLL